MISLIAAVSKNYCIGKNNALPWNIPADLKHFQKITDHKIVLMGRKTFESILSYLKKPLPNRKSIVITRDPNYQAPTNVEIFNNLNKAIQTYSNQNLFIIGGAGIYKQTINQADRLYITWVDKVINGDSFFPKIDSDIWKKVKEEKYDGFKFTQYKKRKN